MSPPDASAAPSSPARGSPLVAFARDIKLSHTIFALPFALSAVWLVHLQQGSTWQQWAWILVAMTGARTSAMGFNRLVDRKIDAANPRTAGRALPSGQVPVPLAWGLTLGSAAVMVLAAGMLHLHALYASPVVLAVIWGYSLAKRVTAWCHLILGLALGLAPVAAWIALMGTVEAPALVLAGIVLTWVGGFDILYALQDREYDASVGLNSIPAKLGEVGALVVSGLLHLGTVALLCTLPLVTALSWPYWLGVAAIAGILAWEHWLVRPGDLSRIDRAFFTLNSYVSLVFLASLLAATW